jgi:hypothetical protein
MSAHERALSGREQVEGSDETIASEGFDDRTGFGSERHVAHGPTSAFDDRKAARRKSDIRPLSLASAH